MTQTATTPANYPRTVADVIVRPETTAVVVRQPDALTVTLPTTMAHGIAAMALLGALLAVLTVRTWALELWARWGKA